MGQTALKKITKILNNSRPFHCKHCQECFTTSHKLKAHTRRVHQLTVQVNAKQLEVVHQGDIFQCLECLASFELPQALQNHFLMQHTSTESGSDAPSSPTKRPRGSLSPVLPKKCARVVNNDVVEETEDEMEVGSDDESVTGLEQGFRQLATVQSHAARELIRLPELEAAPLAIEPHWHITICEPCGYAVPRSMLQRHYGKTHNRSKVLPSNLDELLDSKQVIERAEHPVNVVQPLQSIPIIPGVRCLVPGCGYATRSMGTALNHVYSQHKPHGKEMVEHCNVQWVYHTTSEYWAVEKNYTTFSGDCSRIAEHLDAIKELDRRGVNTGRFERPTNQRVITPFMATFRWGDITEGKEGKELIELVSVPRKGKEDDWAPLKWLNNHYFESIEPIMKNLIQLLCCGLILQRGELYFLDY